MNMVFDTADYDGLAIELLKYSTQIAMQFLPHDWVTQEGRRSLVEKTVCKRILASD